MSQVTSSASTSAVAEGGGRGVHAANDVSYIISVWVDSMFIRSHCASMFRGACIVCDMTFTFVVYIFLFFVFIFMFPSPTWRVNRPSDPVHLLKARRMPSEPKQKTRTTRCGLHLHHLIPCIPPSLPLFLYPFRLSTVFPSLPPSSLSPPSHLPFMFIRPSIHLPSIHPSNQSASFLFFSSPSFLLSLPLCLPSTSICTSVHPSIFPPTHHSINQSVHLFLCPSTDLFFVHFKADSTSRPTKPSSSPLGEGKSAKRAKTADPVNTVHWNSLTPIPIPIYLCRGQAKNSLIPWNIHPQNEPEAKASESTGNGEVSEQKKTEN